MSIRRFVWGAELYKCMIINNQSASCSVNIPLLLWQEKPGDHKRSLPSRKMSCSLSNVSLNGITDVQKAYLTDLDCIFSTSRFCQYFCSMTAGALEVLQHWPYTHRFHALLFSPALFFFFFILQTQLWILYLYFPNFAASFFFRLLWNVVWTWLPYCAAGKRADKLHVFKCVYSRHGYICLLILRCWLQSTGWVGRPNSTPFTAARSSTSRPLKGCWGWPCPG